jgi:ribosomal protein S18 acetylase RimI-like enzyme
MENLSIRPSQNEDDEFLFELYTATNQNEFLLAGLDEMQTKQIMQLQFSAKKQTYTMQFPNAESSIIIKESKPVGYFLVNQSSTEMILVDIALLPIAQGIGIGSNIISDLQTKSKQNNLPFRLHVRTQNERSFQLYQRLGFKITSQDEVYYSMEYNGNS